MQKLTLFAAIFAFAPALAWADSATVGSGAKSQITTHMRYDRECGASRVEIKFLKAPEHGAMTYASKPIVVAAKFARGGAQPEQCIGKTMEGVAVYYQSKPGFAGQDSFSYRRFNPNDDKDRFNADISYTITVK
jgi:hypothetical protein